MNPEVDQFLNNAERWREELEILRAIVLKCGLDETLKWRQPCYTFGGKNVLILSEFKDHCVVSFLKGALLANADNLLVSPGENSQSVRFMRFTSGEQIVQLEAIIKSTIFEAMEIEKSGLKVVLKSTNDLEWVPELYEKFANSPQFEAAFEALTAGRKRGYHLFFSGAKQSKTRTDRIEKYIPRILNGKGINDCVCGLSKRMPNCDGSHNSLKNARD